MADLKLIKKLREETGCGISDCNKALLECGSDYNKSVDWLRKKGLASASKKAGRVAAEGLVAINIQNNNASIIEINSETDFVSKNEKFQDFVKDISSISYEFGNDIESLKLSNYPSLDISIEEELKNKINIIGENLNIRRIDSLSVNNGAIIGYIHNKVDDNMGKIAVLVAIESSASEDKLQELGKQIAMHIAASKPESLDIKSINKDKLSRETEILKEQARSSGKPENIIDKMIEGRIRKYYEEVVLLEQKFVMDDKLKIKDVVKNIGSDAKLTGFKLFNLGEGIEKKEEDFSEEVANVISS